jgi:acyl phosphate:glycerol-3-phosphate acyltransferase
MTGLLPAVSEPNIVWAAVLAPLVAYVIGATPFAWIIARLKGVDLRSVGSGNIGATNVTRAIGRGFGYLCFFLDMGKGLLPTLAMGAWLVPGSHIPSPAVQAIWLGTGVAAVLGHVFPFWLKFRGGKGVATSLGVVLGVFPYFTIAGLLAFALWVAVTLISRYVSLGSIVAAAMFIPLFVAWNAWRLGLPAVGQLWPMIAFAALVAALILIRHRGNLARLLAGTENKIGQRRGGPAVSPDEADQSPQA